MISVFRAVRSFFSMVLVGLWFTLGSLALRSIVIPLIWLRPALRYPVTSRYFKIMSGGIFALLTVGGARFRRRGTLPTAEPVAIIARSSAAEPKRRTPWARRAMAKNWAKLFSTAVRRS